MTPQALLLQAANLIESSGWCQSGYAVNGRGNTVGPAARDAVGFCMTGALLRVAHDAEPDIRRVVLLVDAAQVIWLTHHRRRLMYGPESMVTFNDLATTTRAMVVASLREAAA